MSQPGLPALPAASQPPPPPVAATSDNAKLPMNGSPPQWGLYLNGKPVIVADNVLAIGFKAHAEISTYQVEKGAFESYDKIQLPNTGTVRYSTGTSQSARTDFLASCDAAKQSLNVYDLVMPERIYPSMNVVDYDFERTSIDGLGLLKVDLKLEEVRSTATAVLNTTVQTGIPGQTKIVQAKNPGANDPQNNGQQQPQIYTGLTPWHSSSPFNP